MKHQDRVALVLGGVKGIGKGIGLDLARSGIKVAATYFDWPERVGQMRRDFAATGQEHLIISVDLLLKLHFTN